jgi:hypothetical protein
VLTFEIRGASERDAIRRKEYENLYAGYITDHLTMRLDGYTVPLWGEGHNLYPQQVFSLTSENRLLPEVIQKQVRFLSGKGPWLYRKIHTGEGEKLRTVKVPVEYPAITDWLESREEQGFEHYRDCLMSLAVDFYYVNTLCTKYHFTRARRLSVRSGMLPVAALSYAGADAACLATRSATG